MADDLLVGFFFVGKDIQSIADRQAEFLAHAIGARADYQGKRPVPAHSALPPILAGHFDRRMVILEQTLRDHLLSDGAREAWLRFERSFRKSILKSGAQAASRAKRSSRA